MKIESVLLENQNVGFSFIINNMILVETFGMCRYCHGIMTIIAIIILTIKISIKYTTLTLSFHVKF